MWSVGRARRWIFVCQRHLQKRRAVGVSECYVVCLVCLFMFSWHNKSCLSYRCHNLFVRRVLICVALKGTPHKQVLQQVGPSFATVRSSASRCQLLLRYFTQRLLVYRLLIRAWIVGWRLGNSAMEDPQWGIIDVSHPIEWPRITLLVQAMLVFAHRCAHIVRHVLRSADSVAEFKAVHHLQGRSIGLIGLCLRPETSL